MCGSCILGGVDLPTRWVLVDVRSDCLQAPTDVRDELRRIGAVPIGGSIWAAPDAPVFVEGLERLRARAADGNLSRIDVGTGDPADRMAMLTAFNAARAAEWADLREECRAFDGTREALERLRHRAHEIQARDIFSVPEAEVADRDLRACATASQ